MLGTFSISRQGESHIRHALPCQDSSASFVVSAEEEPRFAVAVVADGVGSEPHSDEGSRVAVDTVAHTLQDALEADEQPQDMLLVVEDAFEEALNTVLDVAEGQELPFAQFATTLTAAVFDGSTLWFGHAGDDGIVVMHADGSYEMVTERHEGELANSVVPFGVHHWQFGEVTDVASCVLMTDGVLDYCVRDESENNRIKLPFLKPLLYAVLETDEELEAARQDWDEFLTTDFQQVVRDDLSLALLFNSEAVAQLPPYDFDVDAWNEETKRYDAMHEERLEELDRERLESDDEYRRLVEQGKERASRSAQQEPAAAGADDAEDADDATPGTATQDGMSSETTEGSEVPETDAAVAPPVPVSPARTDSDRSRAVAEGAQAVVKGIRQIRGALGDAVQEFLGQL